ncbi:MAG: hypothetical protein JWR03_389 [Cohnella sp.]|nr:hypothetical protein [Cohnella sp.]
MGRITQLQVYMLFSQFIYSTLIGFFISPLVKEARYMVWVSVILGAAIGLFIAYLSYRLCIRRPDRALGQYGHEIIGRWFHYPVVAAVIFINLFASALIMRQLVDFIVLNFLPETPDWAVAALFGICIARGVRSGPVTVFRGAQGLFLLSVAAVLSFPLFITREVNTGMAVAFLTNFEPKGMWNGTVMIAGLFAEMTFIVYFFPYITKQEKMMKSLSWAAVTAVTVALANLIPTVLLFGPELTANLTYPTLEVIRYIRAGTFLENLDPLLIIFWLYSMFLKISIFLLTCVLAFTHTAGLRNHKPFSYMMAATMVVFSMYMFPSSAEVDNITTHSETAFLLLTSMVPVLYLLVDWLRSLAKRYPHRAQ